MHAQLSVMILSAVLLVLTAVPAVLGDVPPFINSSAAEDGIFGNYTRQVFLSDPSVVAPVANILFKDDRELSPSKYVGWAPLGIMLDSPPPMLIDAHSFSTVWSGPVLGQDTYNPTVQTCNGTEYLMWWSGNVAGRMYGRGRYYLMNSKYEIVYNISVLPPLAYADVHDISITPHCTAIMTSYESHPFTHNVTVWPVHRLADSHFQEIDLATGELIFHWQASKHIPDMVAESPWDVALWQHKTKAQTLDWFHINSVEKDHLGNYLISARHTCTVYYISGLDGSIIWRLGGPKNDFKDLSGGNATNFIGQHHARWLDSSLTKLSLFDDRGGHVFHDPDPVSRGIILELDQEKREVSLLHSYKATREINSIRKGSMQVLTDSPTPGNVMLGYGDEPSWTEYSPNGTILLDVSFGPIGLDRYSVDNYRSLKVNWTGLPYWGPKIAPGPKPHYVFEEVYEEIFSVQLRDAAGRPLPNDTAYFSWNGATEIKSWIVLASNKTADMTIADYWGTTPKTGFEDSAYVGGSRYVTAFAIDKAGSVLGATDIMDMTSSLFLTGLAGPTQNDTAILTGMWQKHIADQAGVMRNVYGLALLFVLSIIVGIIYWGSRGNRAQRIFETLRSGDAFSALRMRRGYTRVATASFDSEKGERKHADETTLPRGTGRIDKV